MSVPLAMLAAALVLLFIVGGAAALLGALAGAFIVVPLAWTLR